MRSLLSLSLTDFVLVSLSLYLFSYSSSSSSSSTTLSFAFSSNGRGSPISVAEFLFRGFARSSSSCYPPSLFIFLQRGGFIIAALCLPRIRGIRTYILQYSLTILNTYTHEVCVSSSHRLSSTVVSSSLSMPFRSHCLVLSQFIFRKPSLFSFSFLHRERERIISVLSRSTLSRREASILFSPFPLPLPSVVEGERRIGSTSVPQARALESAL